MLILHGVLGQGVHVYIDDVIIYTKTIKEHFEILDEVLLHRPKSANLTINAEKSKLFCKSLVYLGSKISKKGVQILESHIDSIHRLKMPTNRKQIRQFLGAMNFVSRHIENYTKLARPLQMLSGKN